MSTRIALHKPTRIKLLEATDVGREPFGKGQVVMVEAHSAERLIKSKKAEAVKGDDVPVENRWSQAEDKETKKDKALADALTEASKTSTGTPRTDHTEGETVAAGPGAGQNSNTVRKTQ